MTTRLITRLGLLSLLVLPLVSFGRLGETETELVARFGKPLSKSKLTTTAQGRRYDFGESLSFKQDDWRISCDVIDTRCARISYGKTGDWTDEQLQLVLASNSQGGKWTEQNSPHPKMVREWKRSDGAKARWQVGSGIVLSVPAYDRAKEVIESKAKAEASRKPKI